jgi:hypothetical protein
MSEQVKPVAGFPGYSVSNHGRVFSTIRGPLRQLKPWCCGNGYRYEQVKLVRIESDGTVKHHKRKVAHLVALAFIGQRPAGHDVDHIDADTHNNRADNLRYLTQTENRGQGSRRRKKNGLDVAT